MHDQNRRKKQVNVRLSQRILDQAQELVDSGQHPHISDVVETAVIRYVDEEYFKRTLRTELFEMMDTPEYKGKMRELIREIDREQN
jgi:Arc/MetJ-type ribon-helix-helix transcriptional regulator